MSFIETLGQQAAAGATNGLIGAGMGLLLEKHNDKRQLRQGRKLQELELEGNRAMVDYNMRKQLEMWKATSFGGQMDELAKAGLNPGLLYGMGGGGGTTAGNTNGSVRGQEAPKGGGEIIAQQGMGLQLALQKAQIENIQADTEQKKATTTETGTKTDLNKLEIKFREGSLEDRLDQIDTEAKHAIIKMDREDEALKLDRATRLQKADKIKAEAIGEYLANALIIAQTGNVKQNTAESQQRVIQSQAQITKWAQEIMQQWMGLDIQQKQMLIHKMEADFKVQYPQFGQVIGQQMKNVLDGIEKLMMLPGPIEKAIESSKEKK